MMARALESHGRRRAAAGRCGRCGRAYAESEWDGLEIVDRIEGRRLQALVTVWPEERTIEVRACTGCGGALARTVSASA
jgi:hypothetical protein